MRLFKNSVAAAFASSLIATSAYAQCAGGLVVNCPAAVSPQPGDVMLIWQLGQTPHMRSVPLSTVQGQSGQFASPPPLGSTTPNSVAATNLTASGTVSGAGFTSLLSPFALLASPTFTGTVTIPSGASIAGYAQLFGPAFSGTPTAPTAAPLTNTTQLATTAFDTAAVGVETARATAAEALKAPLASPTLTGTPTAPTAAALTNTTQLATTAFDTAAVGVETSRATAAEALKAPLASPTFTGTVTIPAGSSIAGFAPLASPTFTGSPAGPTAGNGTNTTQFATTAFVQNAVAAATSGVSSFNSRTGIVTLSSSDVTGALGFTPYNATNPSGYLTSTTAASTYAPLASPTFTGTVTIPSGATISGFAPLASPVFTGSPTVPGYAPLASPTFTGTVTIPAGASISGFATLASPTFTGSPTVPGYLTTAGATSTYTPLTTAAQGQYKGTATNDNATAGNIGEYVSALVGFASSLSISNGAAANLASVSLAAGDWDCSGSIGFNPAASTVTQSMVGWISTTSATAPTPPNNGMEFSVSNSGVSGGQTQLFAIGMGRLSLSGTTTVYLTAYSAFTTSTMTSYGFIGCRRVR